MSENKYPRKNKKFIRAVVYSFLAFYVSVIALGEALRQKAFVHPGIADPVDGRGFLVVGLSITAAVVFFRWFRKHQSKASRAKG